VARLEEDIRGWVERKAVKTPWTRRREEGREEGKSDEEEEGGEGGC